MSKIEAVRAIIVYFARSFKNSMFNVPEPRKVHSINCFQVHNLRELYTLVDALVELQSYVAAGNKIWRGKDSHLIGLAPLLAPANLTAAHLCKSLCTRIIKNYIL